MSTFTHSRKQNRSKHFRNGKVNIRACNGETQREREREIERNRVYSVIREQNRKHLYREENSHL